MTKCLNCEQPIKATDAIIRGCHEYCYQHLRYCVRTGRHSDRWLVNQGYWSRTKSRGKAKTIKYLPKRKVK